MPWYAQNFGTGSFYFWPINSSKRMNWEQLVTEYLEQNRKHWSQTPLWITVRMKLTAERGPVLTICSYPIDASVQTELYGGNCSKSPPRIPTRDQVPLHDKTCKVKLFKNFQYPFHELCAIRALLTQAIRVVITQPQIRGQARCVVAAIRT